MIDYTKIEYNKSTALFLAHMSSLVYESWDTVKSTLNTFKSKNFVFYEVCETEAFLAEFDNFVVLSFRGTKSLQDWITDLNFKKKKEGDFEAHGGFVKAIDLVWYRMIDFLKNTDKQIFITGHSLGGGLATIASCRLWKENIHNCAYTFGSPRALSKKYARFYNTNYRKFTHRYVNNNDVVVRLPQRILDFGHVGTLHYFEESGKQNDNISWAKKLLDSIEGRLKDIGKISTDGIKDHSMDEYYSLVQGSLNTHFV